MEAYDRTQRSGPRPTSTRRRPGPLRVLPAVSPRARPSIRFGVLAMAEALRPRCRCSSAVARRREGSSAPRAHGTPGPRRPGRTSGECLSCTPKPRLGTLVPTRLARGADRVKKPRSGIPGGELIGSPTGTPASGGYQKRSEWHRTRPGSGGSASPPHVVAQASPGATGSVVGESFDPVTIYLQRRRLGSNTTTRTRAT